MTRDVASCASIYKNINQKQFWVAKQLKEPVQDSSTRPNHAPGGVKSKRNMDFVNDQVLFPLNELSLSRSAERVPEHLARIQEYRLSTVQLSCVPDLRLVHKSIFIILFLDISSSFIS